MSAYFKPVLVLLLSILIFAGFSFLADKELLDLIQARFYNPSVLNSYVRENSRDAELIQGYIFELQSKFAATLTEPAVQSSFLYNQSPDDIYERSRIFGILLESTAGLQSVQFVDSNGIRLHYSTSARDIISQSASSTAYRNYTDDPLSLPYDNVSVSASGSAKFSMDEQNDRIIFSFPFNDSMDVYRGTALYTVSVRALAEKLIAEGRLKVNENVFVTGIPPGIILGSPDTSKIDIIKKVSSIWNDGIQDRVTFDSGDSGMKFSLISLKTSRGIFFGRLVNDGLFYISDSMKNILLLSMFLTFYLTLLFITNFRPNPVTLVKNRIRRLRESLFEQLLNKSGQEKTKWILELDQRREEIRLELKHNLKLGRRAENNINGIIDKSWDELLAVIKAGGDTRVIAESSGGLDAQAGAIETEALDEIEEIEGIGEAEKDGGDGWTSEEFDATEYPQENEEFAEAEELDEISAAEEIEEVDKAEQLDKIAGTEKIEEFAETGEPAETADAGMIEEFAEAREPAETAVVGMIEDIEETDALVDISGVYEQAESGEEAAPVHASGGLLSLASRISAMEKTDEIEELEELEKLETPQPKRGLLHLAISKEEEEPDENSAPQRRGLLALASDIEFSREYPVGNMNENDEDLDAELDIVSPFSSMFLSLGSDDEELN